METLRLFIAVDISEEVRNRLAHLLESLQKAARFTPARPTWVKAGSSHLTLQFLGSVEKEKVESISQAMTKAASQVAPFTLNLAKLGAFPNLRHPKVIWLGLNQGVFPIRHAQESLINEMKQIGFPPEERAFHAHLTLARIKSYKGIEVLMKNMRPYMDFNCGTCLIDEYILFQSQLHPEGSIYTPLIRAKFSKE